MSWTGWLLFVLIVQVIHFLGTWKLYIKAGRQAWEAAVPIYNGVVLMKIINRPWYWVILLFIPIVNLIMFPVVWVETLRSFGLFWTKRAYLGSILKNTWIFFERLGPYHFVSKWRKVKKYIQRAINRPQIGFSVKQNFSNNFSLVHRT